MLTAVVNRAEIAASSGFRAEEKANLRIIRDYLTDTEIRTLQNECGIHICCSEAEGYGHYIAEAMSTGAVTLTTDGPPMNEFIRPGRGILVAVSETSEMNLATKHFFDPASLADAVVALQRMTVSEKALLGKAARDWFLSNKSEFPRRFRDVLAGAVKDANG
jgi:glycosyltransferase involved in cell wall biosynthesis